MTDGHRDDRAVRPAAVDPRQLRSDDIRYFLEVAQSGHLRSAAINLGVDHTTVSRRVRALEKALGVRLLQRSPDGWTLTDVGRSVAERARVIETAVQETADIVSGDGIDPLRGTVRVIAPDAFGSLFVAPALARMRLHHPQLAVELITATRQLNLHQSGFDVAIAVGTPVSSRLVTEVVADYSMRLYAASAYLQEHGEPTTLVDLEAHPLVFFVDSLLQVGDLDLTKHLPGVSAKFMSTNIFAHLAATRAGGGVGLLPAFMAEEHEDLRCVLPDQLDVRLTFHLAARRESLTNPAVQAVRDAIHAETSARRHELVPGAS